MEYPFPRRRWDLQPKSGYKIVENAPMCPPAYSETDSDYYSSIGSSGPGQSECNYSDTMSESDWSKDSPPYFQDQPRKDSTTTKNVSSPIEVAAFIIVVVAVLYFACSLFSRETVTQHVKIVLPSCSGESKSAMVIEELLSQLKKQEVPVSGKVRLEIQAKEETSQVTDNAEGSLLVYAIKVFFVFFVILGIIGFFVKED